MGVEGRPGWREVGGPMITSVEGTFSHIEYVSPVWPAGQGPRAQVTRSTPARNVKPSRCRLMSSTGSAMTDALGPLSIVGLKQNGFPECTQSQDVATKKSMTHGKGVALLPNKTPDTTFGVSRNFPALHRYTCADLAGVQHLCDLAMLRQRREGCGTPCQPTFLSRCQQHVCPLMRPNRRAEASLNIFSHTLRL